MFTLEYRKGKSKLSVSDDKKSCIKQLLNGELEWEYITAVTSQSGVYIQPIDFINSTTYSMQYIENSMNFHRFFNKASDDFYENPEIVFQVCHNAMNTLWEHRKVIVSMQNKYPGIEHTDITDYNLLVNLDDYSVKIMDIDSIRVKPENLMGAMTSSYKSTLNTIIHMQSLVAEKRDRDARST
tara:strand:+ start:965 stop:1513 length:549 start_codon:yes stop_codon:yes gene_type:complete